MLTSAFGVFSVCMKIVRKLPAIALACKKDLAVDRRTSGLVGVLEGVREFDLML